MTIQILKNSRGKWYWRIRAANHRILAHSEAYSSLRKASDAAKSVIVNMGAGAVRIRIIRSGGAIRWINYRVC